MRRFQDRQLLVATHNAGKLEEMRALLKPYGVAVVGSSEMGLPEPAETESTFLGNARIKAHFATRATGLPALADDSGIEVLALDGAPGVHTADWAETGSGRDFILAMTRTHDALVARAAPAPWSARFQCTLVLAWPDEHDEVFTGTANGHLVWPIRGHDGHGYDPMFVPEGETRTFSEISAQEKNRISHRAKAIAALVRGCFT